MEPFKLGWFMLHFDPPINRPPRRNKRSVIIDLKDGTDFSGIAVYYRNGEIERIEIPDELDVDRRQEWLTQKVTLREVDKEVVRMRIRDEYRYRPHKMPARSRA